MAMVVDVAGRGECRDVTAVHGPVVGQAQFGPAVLMADCVPPLMGLHPADGGDRDPAMVGVGVAITPSGRWNSTRRGPRSGLISHVPPADSEGISAISGLKYSSSAASSTKTRPTWSISRTPAERTSSS